MPKCGSLVTMNFFFFFFLLPRGARRHRRPADMLKFTAGGGASDTGRGSGSRGMSSNRSSSTARLVSITQAADERQITLNRGPGVCRPPLEAPVTPQGLVSACCQASRPP